MAVAPAVLAGVAIAATLASTAVAVTASVQQGKAQKAQANYQASLQERQAAIDARNAQLAKQQTEQRVADRRERFRRLEASNRARAGASGIELSGSFLDVELDNLMQSEMDVANLRFGGGMESLNLMEQADASRSNASMSRVMGKERQTASYLSAGGQALSGLSSAASMGYRASNFTRPAPQNTGRALLDG